MKVEFYRHSLTEEDITSVSEVLRSVFLTSGPKTALFEKQFAEYLNAKKCVATSSWTTGAFITLKALGIGPGDEVITSPLTFIATANIVLHCGAKPVFVDVEPKTGNIDVSLLRNAISKKTKAIMPVHLYGQMCDMRAIAEIAREHNLYVLEDCAHAVESMRDGIRPAQLSDAAIFSFYATKNLTCGEGGAVVTNDEALSEKLLLYRLHGMTKDAASRYHGLYQHWDQTLLGYKCNLPDIQSALLLGQLQRLEANLDRRTTLAARYEKGLAGLPAVSIPSVLANSKHARHLFTIWVDPNRRDEILRKLQESEIGVAVNFRAIHLLSYWQQQHGYKPGMFPVAEKIGSSTISLPFYPALRDEAVDYVASVIRDLL